MPPRGWATVSVREDVRRALEEIASQKGFSSLNDVIAFLLDKYRELTDVSAKLTDISVRLTDMSVRCDELLTDISVKLDRLLQAGAGTTGPPFQATTQGRAGAGAGGGYEWCRPRSSIKNLGGFISYLERRYGLEDWWEEDDRVCFKTARPPRILGEEGP